MVKKKEVGDELKLLKARVQDGEIIIGAEQVLKRLKGKKLQQVFMASNCPPSIKKDVLYYASLAQVPVTELAQTNEELGVFCKKNFFISVLGIPGE